MGSQKSAPRVQHAINPNTQIVESQEKEQESELAIPQPVTEGELDGATLR